MGEYHGAEPRYSSASGAVPTSVLGAEGAVPHRQEPETCWGCGRDVAGLRSTGRVPVQPYLLVDVARAPLPALFPAQQLACLQKPVPGTACPWPGCPWMQLLEPRAIPKVFRP